MPKNSTSHPTDTSRKAYPLRIDTAVFDQVREKAKQEGRSVNRQIEFLLRQSLESNAKNS